MFEPTAIPRVFAVPVDCDFSTELIQGLRNRLVIDRPEDIASVEIFVNTRRTQRRLEALFTNGPPTLLPRIRLITDIGDDFDAAIPPAASSLRRRLELSQTVAALLEGQPDIAPRSSLFDLADGLATLLDEMHGEGVTPDDLHQIDVSQHSAHWERSLQFLDILSRHFAYEGGNAPDAEARQRMVVEDLAQRWAQEPPQHPVIVAGSTGSRGVTALLMKTVASLPNGAVVLPGFDFLQPDSVWEAFEKPDAGLDHPQSGMYRLLGALGLAPQDVAHWTSTDTNLPERNRLISLALRPAPVTDQWLSEGPTLGNLDKATSGISLLEAPSQRIESVAIACRLRAAVENGQRAALITPDRNLARQVTAALSRWNILPDDSAGIPLALSPPGVFLRLVSSLMGKQITSHDLATLLKHPLTNTVSENRNLHLLRTRDLELGVLRRGYPFPDFPKFHNWAADRKNDNGAAAWVAWLEDALSPLADIQSQSLADHLKHLRIATETLARGPLPTGETTELWQQATGIEAARLFSELETEADAAGILSPSEFIALFRSVLNKGEVREPLTVHPGISIWGTLEARVQGADLVILGGLNDGIWPKSPTPDPWLSRSMREQAGLLLPERQIGLSAHDFQQAISAGEVMITRAVRDADTPTVASRWLVRITNLLSGLGNDGEEAVASMRSRGQRWLALAQQLEQPTDAVPPAKRPSPMPPFAARPTKLSVTRIAVLIRDPYAIYARYVLGLKTLDPINTRPDPAKRGQILHAVLEKFVKETLDDLPADAGLQLLGIAEEILERDAPWPAARRIWLARLAKVCDWFVESEVQRRMSAKPLSGEKRGEIKVAPLDFTLSGIADRVDVTEDSKYNIYDYKTGTPPSVAQVGKFDKQLPLEAKMAELGGFKDLPAAPAAAIEYIGLASGGKSVSIPLDDELVNKTWEGLKSLLVAYQEPDTGYTARARMEKRADRSDYDHLSRRGEWDDSDPSNPEPVG